MARETTEELGDGRYRLGARIGKGAMGTVREALDARTGETVAVKLLLPELAEDPVCIERFRREALAAAALDHPGIVRVLDSSEDPPYLVMERVAGEPLPRGPLEPDRAVQIACKLLDALEAAHEAGIVHRDLKPSNVLLVGDQPKILDFGIAKLSSSKVGQQLTRSGERMGTPAFASPEQMSSRDVDGRADLYSVGLLLSRMLTGEAPPRSALASVLTGQAKRAPDPRVHRPSLDRGLAAVVVRATALDREERFESAAAMRAALAPYAVARRRGSWLPYAIGLAVLLLVAALVAFWPAPSSPPAPAPSPRVTTTEPTILRPEPRAVPPQPEPEALEPEAPAPTVLEPAGSSLGMITAGPCRALEVATCECARADREARCATTRARIRAWMTSGDFRDAQARCEGALAQACP
ncbi:MAG: serine/threonine protein kinase [Sandaracinaceae bacterium]|nr:serine/threonine protein kinase [Sandaracinaceae bacterium]